MRIIKTAESPVSEKKRTSAVFIYEYGSEINVDILFLDVMAFGIARKEKGQSAVPCYVAGSAKAVLKSKNSKHQGSAGFIKSKHAGDDTKGCHNRSSGDTGSTDGKYAQKKTEKDHGANRGKRAVQDSGNRHTEKYLCENRTAKMDICKKRNTKLYHILPKRLCLPCALKSNGKGGC